MAKVKAPTKVKGTKPSKASSKALKSELKQRKRAQEAQQEILRRKYAADIVIQRQKAMEFCAALGFTMDNVEGVSDIKPRILGMKGKEVDFDAIQFGNGISELKVDGVSIVGIPKEKKKKKKKEKHEVITNRVDLGHIQEESTTDLIASSGDQPAGLDGDFVGFDFTEGMGEMSAADQLDYNHKMRRKLQRAIDAANIKKERLVRAKGIAHCKANGIEVPPELEVDITKKLPAGKVIREDGTVEPEKERRARKVQELAEFNKVAKSVRKQAKLEARETEKRIAAEKAAQDALDETATAKPSVDPKAEASTETSKSTKKRRIDSRNSDDEDVETSKKSKKSKTSEHVPALSAEVETTPRKIKSSETKPEVSKDALVDVNPQVDSEEAARKEQRRLKRDKKLKRSRRDDAEVSLEKSKSQCVEDANSGAVKTDKPLRTRSAEVTRKTSSGAEQWNPNALTGNTARKDKFLRLLGAGKVGTKAEKSGSNPKSGKGVVDLLHVEQELERQFEAGIRMKHDGQGKRRGLGA